MSFVILLRARKVCLIERDGVRNSWKILRIPVLRPNVLVPSLEGYGQSKFGRLLHVSAKLDFNRVMSLRC